MGVYMNDLDKWDVVDSVIQLPYEYDSSVTSSMKKVIEAAMKVWTDCADPAIVAFTERNSETNYILFDESDLPRVSWSGSGAASPQTVYVAPSAEVKTVVHELGHTLGLKHEQLRPDRDDYVDVIPHLVVDGALDQYTPALDSSKCTTVGDFDYKSTQMYRSDLFMGDCNRWSEGWDLVIHWRVWTSIEHDRVFIIKSSTGECEMREINFDGTLSSAQQTVTLDTGWTAGAIPIGQASGDGITGTPSVMYLFNADTGKYKSYTVTGDGVDTSSSVEEHTWSKGWSNIEIWNTGMNQDQLYQNYIIMMKDTGETHIDTIDPESGKISTPKEAYDFSVTDPVIAVSDSGYLFVSEPSSGDFYVYSLTTDPSIKLEKSHSWSEGWSVLSLWNEKDLMIMYKTDGTVKVEDISDPKSISNVTELSWYDDLGYVGITDATMSGTLIAYNPSSTSDQDSAHSHITMLDIDGNGSIKPITNGLNLVSTTSHDIDPSEDPTSTDVDTVKDAYGIS